jgi:hypothetical protein
MSHRVFISYSREDGKTANAILEYLQEHGVPCWIDREDLRFTGKYDREIEKAIRTSLVVLWLASSRSVASDYVKFEIATAIGNDRLIGPVYLEPMDPARLPPPFNLKLANVQGIEWFRTSEQPNLQMLAAELRRLLLRHRLRKAAVSAGMVVALVLLAALAVWRLIPPATDASSPAGFTPKPSAASEQWIDPPPRDLPVAAERLPVAELLKIAYGSSPPPPPPETPRPTLQLEILARRHGESDFARLEDGDALASQQDDYFLVIRPLSSGFLYIFQLDSVGKKVWLFPRNETSDYSSGANPVVPGKVLQVPSASTNRVLFLDTTVGVEHIYSVFSATPWPEFQQALEHPDASSPSPPNEKPPAILLQTAAIRSPIGLATRGVGGARPKTADVPTSFSVERTEGQRNWRLAVTAQPIQASGSFLVIERWFRHVTPN